MVPEFSNFIQPCLNFYGDKKPHRIREAKAYLRDLFKLTDKDCALMTKKGNKSLLSDRTDWSIMYLNKSGCIQRVGYGSYQITELGLSKLKNTEKKVNRYSLFE